jgi:hypothetical protein
MRLVDELTFELELSLAGHLNAVPDSFVESGMCGA